MGVNKQRIIEGKSKGKPRDSEHKASLKFGDYRFCRIELTASERDACRDEITADPPDLGSIDTYLASGYTVKFSPDSRGNGVQVSVTCTDVENGDAGLILTGRGGTARTAWGVFLYKDLAVCDGRTWRETEHERGGSYQDIG